MLDGFDEIVRLMHRIKDSGNDWPRVRLSFHEHPLHFTVAGERSRFPGCVNLTDGGQYGQNKWYGRITVDGHFQPGEAARNLDAEAKKEFWNLLKRLRDGEAEQVFSEFGKNFGTCCICGRDLTNEESVAQGIGPICRQRAFG